MFVKKIEINSGQSTLRKKWEIYNKENELIGTLFQPIHLELDGGCGTYYISAKKIYDPVIYATFWDAITKGLGIQGSMKEIDDVCELFFKEGFKLD